MSTQSKLVEVVDVSKSFGSTRALQKVSLSISAGEVVALVGENGAGKSTLGKIIGGAHSPDEGDVFIDGKAVSFHSTSDARAHGISIVLQEFNLIPEMSVAENVYLARPEGYKLGFWRNAKQQQRDAQRAISSLQMDFGISPSSLVGTLSVAQQQIVEIVRSVSADARLFILDEPSAALGRRETEALLDLIRRLRSDGRSVVIVTHRLDEVFAVADRILVLRDGVAQDVFDPQQTTTEELIKAMVGRELGDELQHVRTRGKAPGEVVVEVKDLKVSHESEPISFQVRSGEIVGLAGLVGSGRTELVRAIFGADHAAAGQVHVNGLVGLANSPANGARHGMALVPENRKEQGLHLELPISFNATLSELARNGKFWLRRRKMTDSVQQMASSLKIKTSSIDLPARSLSGGNQQKVVLAKWLLAKPQLLILDEPTRGIDVGARADFYRVIDGLVEDGMAVIIISSELPEVLALADRVLIISQGRIVRELAAADASEELILASTDIASPAHTK